MDGNPIYRSTPTSLYGEKMNWKIIIKPINVGWLTLKPKATNSSLRPIRTANREKHRKEFIWKKEQSQKMLIAYKLTFECLYLIVSNQVVVLFKCRH